MFRILLSLGIVVSFLAQTGTASVALQDAEKLAMDVSGSGHMVLTFVRKEPEQQKDPIVLIYETATMPTEGGTPSDSIQEHVQRFTQQLQKKGYNFEVVGQGSEWKGWGSKVKALLPVLGRLDSDQPVIVLDSRDMLVNAHLDAEGGLGPKEFGTRFAQLMSKKPGAVVVGAEPSCCTAAMTVVDTPGAMIDASGARTKRSCVSGQTGCLHQGQLAETQWRSFFERFAADHGKPNTKHRFPNAGMLAGKAKDVVRLYNYTAMDEDEEDQALLAEAAFRKPDWVLLDYDQQLFGNTDHSVGVDGGGCNYKLNDGALQAVDTGATPLFLHTSGKFWKCYRNLASNLGMQLIHTESADAQTNYGCPQKSTGAKEYCKACEYAENIDKMKDYTDSENLWSVHMACKNGKQPRWEWTGAKWEWDDGHESCQSNCMFWWWSGSAWQLQYKWWEKCKACAQCDCIIEKCSKSKGWSKCWS